MTLAGLAIVVALLKGRSITEGVIASIALISPSMMMVVEGGNIDLFIFALVRASTLLYGAKQANSSGTCDTFSSIFLWRDPQPEPQELITTDIRVDGSAIGTGYPQGAARPLLCATSAGLVPATRAS